MHQIKAFFNILDAIAGLFWSFTLIDVLPFIFSGHGKSLLSDFSGIVNVLISIAGLIYLVFRIIHFARMSRLHIEYKKQEILEKKDANFYKRFHDEFLKDKK